jgi:hypothetical protein
VIDEDKPSVESEGNVPAYEPPQIEDLPAPEGVTVTAAGTGGSLTGAAPRDL